MSMTLVLGLFAIAYTVYLTQILNSIRNNVERIADTLDAIEKRQP